MLPPTKKPRRKPALRPAPSPSTKSYKMVFANVNSRSVQNKLDSPEALLLAIDQDFLVVKDTWLTGDIEDTEIAPPNYGIVTKDRATRGGGVAILIKKRIRFTQTPVVEGAEALYCNLLFGSFLTTVGSLYRSPGTDHIANNLCTHTCCAKRKEKG